MMRYGIGRRLSFLVLLGGLFAARSHAEVALTLLCEGPAQAGDPVEVAVVAELSNASLLGAISATVSWDAGLLGFVSITDGEYEQLTVNNNQISTGQLSFNTFKATGQAGRFTLAELVFEPLEGAQGNSQINISVDELVAALSFEDLLSQLTTQACSVALGDAAEAIDLTFNGPAAVAVGEQFTVTVGATVPQDVTLGALAGTLAWDATLLRFLSVEAGSYAAEISSNTQTAADGQMRFNAFDAVGKQGAFSLAVVSFEALGEVGNTAELTILPDESVAAQSFEDLLARMRASSYRVDFTEAGEETLLADFDGNNQVDFADFFLFANFFDLTVDSPDWDPIYDLVPNGQVDFADFFLFVDAFVANSP